MAYEVWNTCFLVPEIVARDCASWVQAWGSLGALAVAIGVGWYQARRSAKSAEAAIKHSEHLLDLQRVDRVAEAFAAPLAIGDAFVSTAKELCAEFLRKAEGKKGARPIPSPPPQDFVPKELYQRLESIKAAFDGLPVHSVPGGPGVSLMLALRMSIRRAIIEADVFEQWLLNHWGPCPHGPSFLDRIAIVEGELTDLRSEAVRMAQPA